MAALGVERFLLSDYCRYTLPLRCLQPAVEELLESKQATISRACQQAGGS